jgi:hypothetical protein
MAIPRTEIAKIPKRISIGAIIELVAEHKGRGR